MRFAAALGIAYLLGSVPSAYLLVKGLKGIDIRTVGSGNVGATNTLRAVGPWAGVTVLLIDMAKGLLAVKLLALLVPSSTAGQALGCGLSAVVGHCFPCFLRFRGGKGVATTLGALLGSSPIVAGLVIGVWGIVFALSRYVSLASIAAAAAIPISQLLQHQSLPEVTLGSCLAALVVVRHRANVERLLGGVEHRAWSTRKATSPAAEQKS